MKGTLIGLLIIYTILSQTVLACEAIPDDLLKYMKSLDDPLSPVPDEKFLPYDPYFDSYTRKNIKTPGCITGDFKGNNLVSYALLVAHTTKKVSLVVFSQGQDQYTHDVVQLKGGISGDANLLRSYLTLEGPGKVSGGEETVDLENMAIGLNTSKAGSIIYWKNNAFHEVWTYD